LHGNVFVYLVIAIAYLWLFTSAYPSAAVVLTDSSINCQVIGFVNTGEEFM